MRELAPLDPLVAIAGGLLIGLAAAIFLLFSGRIAGISGMFARSFGVADTGTPRGQAFAFVLGLPLGTAFGDLPISRHPYLGAPFAGHVGWKEIWPCRRNHTFKSQDFAQHWLWR